MSLLVTNSRGGVSVAKEQESVPPLFAGPLRDDLMVRIESALAAGDDGTATALLEEADGSFAEDTDFTALRLHCVKLAQQKAHLEAALKESLDELSEDRFVCSLGKFREALLLSRGYELLEQRVCAAGVAAANDRVPTHWRFAEMLLQELALGVRQPIVSAAIQVDIDRRKREETVRVALEDSARVEHTEYLPHLRERLAELAKTYPGEEGLESRLRVLDGLLAQRMVEERDKNLRRLTLFRNRLDASDNPETLRQFPDLVAPFVAPYRADPAFVSALEDVQGLQSSYYKAEQLLADNHFQETLEVCNQALNQRPTNVLLCILEERAKAGEWRIRLGNSNVQRARAFEQKGLYVEALEEWEALRAIDPHYPGLDSDVLHCAALIQHAELLGSPAPPPANVEDDEEFTPEIVYALPEYHPPAEFIVHPPSERARIRLRIAITEEAWNNFKTGLAATAALLLVVLVFATNARR